MASLKDPSKAWVKDQSGKHTNLTAVLDWPDSDSDVETYSPAQTGGHSSASDRDSVFSPGTVQLFGDR